MAKEKERSFKFMAGCEYCQKALENILFCLQQGVAVDITIRPDMNHFGQVTGYHIEQKPDAWHQLQRRFRKERKREH